MNQFWHIIISPYGHQVLMQFIQSTFFQREKNPTTRTHVQFNSEEKSVAIQVALSTKKRKKKKKRKDVRSSTNFKSSSAESIGSQTVMVSAREGQTCSELAIMYS